MALQNILHIFLLQCLVYQSVFTTILRVNEDHSYQRLSVEVTDQVPRHLCQNTLNNLEKLLTATSANVFRTTKSKARFDTITVLLPASWSGTDCLNDRPINDKISTNPHPDFLVTSDHPIFGAKLPQTLQFGQCGQAGLGIRIPHALLSSGNLTEFTKMTTFREWVHYRYGTYSEMGFESDPLYPSYYQSGPLEKASVGCRNLTLDSNLDTEQMVDASILRNKAICDVTTDHYDRDAPTKQNLLCNRQAALEMMLNHPDLKDNDNAGPVQDGSDQVLTKKIRNVESFQIELVLEEDNDKYRDEDILDKELTSELNEVSAKAEFKMPTFSYILPTRRRHILVLDISQAMNIERQWEMARNALFRFITAIPEGDEVAIVSFGANARINIEPTEVTSSNREGLYGRVPFRLLNGQQGCLECGLRMALKLMESPRAVSNGAVVVLTATPGHPSSVLQEVAFAIEEKALPLYLVAFEPKMHQDVAVLTKYGASYVINQGFVLQNLADIFVEILNKGRDLNMRIEKAYQRTFALDNQRHEVATSGGKRGIAISGNFVVEDNLRSNVWVILTSPYKEDVELFEITSPSGQRKHFPQFENGIVYFYIDGLSEAGIWSYKASLYPVMSGSGSASVNEVTVEVIAQPTSVKEDTINVEAWTSVDPNEGASALDKPVILYARVTKGQDLPVMNAKVVAMVQRPDSSLPFEVTLLDQGTGYPDITSGDGVYSAYFTGYTAAEGLYSLDIQVTHNEGSASTPSLLDPLNLESFGAGSGSIYIPVNEMYTTPTAQFSRYIKAPAFYVTQGIQYISTNGQPEIEDVFPPSRITDLSVLDFVNNTLYATLRWSAPGGDFNLGMADSYEIRCYSNAEALSDTNFANMGIPVHDSLLPQPGQVGVEQTATVNLPWANEVFYYGLVAVDASGNRSPVSNLIPVYATEIINESDDVNQNVNDVLIEGSSAGSNGYDSAFSSAVRETLGSENLIFILIGGVCGIVFIISLISLAVFCRAKHRKAEEKRKQNARTQIFVNDLEANSVVLPDLTLQGSHPEKPQNYSEVWATHASTGLPNNSSPTNSSLEEYANMYINNSGRSYPIPQSSYTGYAGHTGGVSLPQSSGYPSTVPVHEYRSSYPGHMMGENQINHQQVQFNPEDPHSTTNTANTVTVSNNNSETPTYQNWTHKPPSDNGTATTSSTECYDDHNSDHSHKNNNNGVGVAGHVRVAPLRRYSVEDYIAGSGSSGGRGSSQDPASALSLSPSFCSSSEKRRRQESLV